MQIILKRRFVLYRVSKCDLKFSSHHQLQNSCHNWQLASICFPVNYLLKCFLCVYIYSTWIGALSKLEYDLTTLSNGNGFRSKYWSLLVFRISLFLSFPHSCVQLWCQELWYWELQLTIQRNLNRSSHRSLHKRKHRAEVYLPELEPICLEHTAERGRADFLESFQLRKCSRTLCHNQTMMSSKVDSWIHISL